jgi:NitT/TauT family transport system permease protein
LSAKVVEPAVVAAAEMLMARHGTARARPFGLAEVLAPAVAAAVALGLHVLLPNRQFLPPTVLASLPAWQRPYPVVLEGILAAALLAAVIQAVWGRARPWVRYYAPLVAGAVAVFALWDLVTLKLAWLAQPHFPGPDEVLGALVEDREILLLSTWHSLQLLLAGYAAGAAAGLVTGVLIGWFPAVRYWAMPALKVIGPIPATALIPLVMTLSNESFVCAVALVGFAVWFPVSILTASGIANVRLSYLDVARTLGAGRLFLIFRVAIPAALPTIFVGLFMGLGASFLALIVAESVGVQAGLGWYLKWQQGYVEYAKVYAAIGITAGFSSALMTLLFVVRDRVLKWQKGVIKW